MIFFANAQGSITKIITEEVYQGSVGVNRVVLVAPYPASATVTVAFTLPNGIRTPENLTTRIQLEGLLTTNNGAEYNAWTYLLEEAITEYAGTLVAQFIVRDSASRKQTTFATTLTVQKGVAPILPETPSPTVYEEILNAFAYVNERLTQLEGMPLIKWVDSLPTENIDTKAIYAVSSYMDQVVSYYVYTYVLPGWLQINKSVITTANSNAIVDSTKLYILTADSNDLSAGVYVVRDNAPLKLLTSEEYAEINNEIERVEGKADNAQNTADNAQSTANTANQNANTAVSTANTAYNTAQSASETANTANQTASNASQTATTALEKAIEALNKAGNVTGGLVPKGSIDSIADLPTPSAETLGFVYNVNDAFVTNDEFVEGAGISYLAGENVAIVEPTPGVYKYDVFSGIVDLSNYQEKLVSGQNIKTINGNSILGTGNIDINSIYLLSLAGDSGTLTTDQNSALVAKYPQVMVKLNDVYTLLPVAKVDNMYYFQLVEIGEDDQGKYAGTIYVNINSTTRAWEFGEQYNDIPTGNGLPEVTTADAGEVLTVSNQGEWQAQPLPVYDGATEGGTIGGGSGGNYVLELTGESGTLTDEQYQAVVDNFPNVVAVISNEYGASIAYQPRTNIIAAGNFLFDYTTYVEGMLSASQIVILPDKTFIVVTEPDAQIPQGGSGGGGGSGETFKTRLTTVFSTTPTTLSVEDMQVFAGIMQDNNITPITQVVFNVTTDGDDTFVGFLSNCYSDFVNNLITLTYKTPIYILTLTANLDTGVMQGYFSANDNANENGVATIEISQTGASGLLDVDAVSSIVDRFPNVNIRVLGKYIYTPLEFDATTNTYKFANVNTSDTQAETKLITVNANTNEWTSTQYLTNLGGGGGITKQKVTLAELKALFTPENFGVLVTVLPKVENLPSEIDSSILNFITSANIVTPINNSSGEWGIGYQYISGLSIGDDSTHTITTGLIVIMQEGILGMGINSDLVAPIDFTPYITDEYFDFYIYK